MRKRPRFTRIDSTGYYAEWTPAKGHRILRAGDSSRRWSTVRYSCSCGWTAEGVGRCNRLAALHARAVEA